MKKRTELSGIFAIVAMLALLAMSYGLDSLILSMKEYVSVTFKGVVSMLLLYPLSTILVATGAFLLFWFTTARMKKNYLVVTVFIVIGVFIELLVLSNIPALGSAFIFLQPFLLPSSNLFFTGALVMMIGVLNLLLPHPKE